MAKVVVLGAGAMGSAFCFPLADAGNEVHLVGTHLDDEWVEAVGATGKHPAIGIRFPDGVSIHPHKEFDRCRPNEAELLVVGVSSAGIEWAAEQIALHAPGVNRVLLLTKGLAVLDGLIRILPEVMLKVLRRAGLGRVSVGAVAGPCIAAELAARRHSSVVIACADPELLEFVEQATRIEYYHASTSADLKGVELCAALKNLFAIGVGYATGSHSAAENEALAHNPTAALFAQAVRELNYLVTELGGDIDSVYGLPGIGDLHVTSQSGRNSRLGGYLGTGLTFTEAKSRHMKNDTVEGAELTFQVGPTLEKMMDMGTLDGRRIPLARAIIGAVCHDRPLLISWNQFE